MHFIKNIRTIIIVLFITVCAAADAQSLQNLNKSNAQALFFFAADNKYFQYFGRVDFSNPALPRFWSPGVYIKAKFRGQSCEVVLNDEVLYGNNHNYIEIVIDDAKPIRIQTTGKTNTIKAAGGLSNGEHTITICKNTESGIGYLEFAGLRCKELMPADAKPLRKIECIGNSITCGAGSDLSKIKCDSGQWYDQHNAYLSYGATTARNLKAQWQLTSVSGIGLIHSCCNMTVTMPQVFDKVNLRTDSIKWDFKNYKPQVVTICLGQNDGKQDSVKFCTAYVAFIQKLRNYYPKADLICLTSPMADAALTAVLKNYLTGIVDYINKKGDNQVTKYFFSRSYNNGCGGHPDVSEHQEIAKELTSYISRLKGW